MKERFNGYFDKLTPTTTDDEFLVAVRRKAEKMDKKMRINKKAIAIPVAAALMVGATAAATGLFGFNELFSGYIVSDESIGDELLSTINEVKVNSSDDDYTMELKSVTGTKDRVMGRFEIVRTDGAPILTEGDWHINSIWGANSINENDRVDPMPGAESFYMVFDSTDTGNVGGYFEVYSEDYTIADTPIQIVIDDLFIGDENGNSIMIPVQMCMEFEYTPSEKALLEKKISGENNSFELSLDGLKPTTVEATILDSYFSCLGGWISLEYNRIDDTTVYCSAENEMVLVMEDGTEIMISSTGHDGRFESVFFVQGHQPDYRLGKAVSAVDISKAVAVRINGMEFPLE